MRASCPCRSPIRSERRVSQSCAWLSSDALTSTRPDLENATDVTPAWSVPCEYTASSRFARRSNRRHVASSDPLATAEPSGKKSTELTSRACPTNICAGCAVRTSHTNTRVSHDPETNTWGLLGASAKLRQSANVPGDITSMSRKLARPLLSSNVPQGTCCISRPREHLTVAPETARTDIRRMPNELPRNRHLHDRLPPAQVVDRADIIQTTGRDQMPGRRVGTCHHPTHAQGHCLHFVTRLCIPHNEMAILRCRKHMVAVRSPVYRIDFGIRTFQHRSSLERQHAQRRDLRCRFAHCVSEKKHVQLVSARRAFFAWIRSFKRSDSMRAPAIASCSWAAIAHTEQGSVVCAGPSSPALSSADPTRTSVLHHGRSGRRPTRPQAVGVRKFRRRPLDHRCSRTTAYCSIRTARSCRNAPARAGRGRDPRGWSGQGPHAADLGGNAGAPCPRRDYRRREEYASKSRKLCRPRMARR